MYFGIGRDNTNKIGFQKNLKFNNHSLVINFMNTETDGYKAKVTSTKNHSYEN